MKEARIGIIGGGLSGLYAAFLLQRQGIEDYVLLEARPAFGGRILSVSNSGMSPSAESARVNRTDRFDLGPTWFWPDMQPKLDRLVSELDIERFPQHETGDMLVERSPREAPLRMRGYATSPTSIRLAGGMAALIDALRDTLRSERIVSGQQVRRVRRADEQIDLDAEDSQGRVTTYRAECVLLAVPPRLAVANIEFAPALPDAMSKAWRNTATWMAPHAKYIAAYDRPFWRDEGFSGEARSATGPLVEIHDASMPGGSAALFGFVGVPARTRLRVSDDALRAHCRAQLARLFGPQAAEPRFDVVKDWAADPYTATAMDLDAPTGHPAAPAARVATGGWRDRLMGIASEWSSAYPGYVAGAIDAADAGVCAMIEAMARK
ncbi:FAD-dependent oxidoreductase (plasmid) [Burkholderia vietnamiensis]|uniref:Amine oxidase n=1 Tax=Burkholderia vietnamiensis (strain G4 / LMG 22486) TaxID=269482 RepID=A4JTI6_BURVG|nr:amine oxidase [Burkholderia vietnamiensis G4]MCB4350255.1 FAD-dependent oxidoreductase [Burkholderia vietnamiensis]